MQFQYIIYIHKLNYITSIFIIIIVIILFLFNLNIALDEFNIRISFRINFYN
jgi:hypothetical protein